VNRFNTSVIGLCLVVVTIISCKDDKAQNDDNEEPIYQAAQLTCSGIPVQIEEVFTLTFGIPGVLNGIKGFTEDPPSACTAVYLLSNAVFSDDNTFTYTRSASADRCADYEGNSVLSCTVNGTSCDTDSTGLETIISGTYSRSDQELELTYSSDGESFCPAGDVEIVNFIRIDGASESAQ